MSYRVLFSSRSLPAAQYGDTYDALSRDWANWCLASGVTPFMVPNRAELASTILTAAYPDLLILTGGNNIDPHRYQQGECEAVADVSEDRDATEFALITLAIEKRIPVLGICRGMQFINVFFGGTLRRHGAEEPEVALHAGTTHEVELRLPSTFNQFPESQLVVNSYHRQTIGAAQLAAPLRPLAVAPDGVVEALHHHSAQIFGIQWHPERKSPSSEFDSFLLNMILENR